MSDITQSTFHKHNLAIAKGKRARGESREYRWGWREVDQFQLHFEGRTDRTLQQIGQRCEGKSRAAVTSAGGLEQWSG